MSRLSKSEKHYLATYNDWKEWGERLGFVLYGTNDEHAADFILPNGEKFYVPRIAREMIDKALAHTRPERS